MESLASIAESVTRRTPQWESVLAECALAFIPELTDAPEAPGPVLAEFCSAHPDQATKIYAWLDRRRSESDQERARRERNEAVVQEYTQVLHLVEPEIPDHPLDFGQFHPRPKHPDVRKALELTRDWMEHRGAGLLTLSGPPGVGKSHLAIAAARALMLGGKTVVYRTEAVLVRELQAGIKTNCCEQVLAELCEVPWLILDEMFISGIGAWTAAHIDTLVNARWEHSETLRTLITTNAVGEQLSPRIASRLSDVLRAKTVVIRASDYRRERR